MSLSSGVTQVISKFRGCREVVIIAVKIKGLQVALSMFGRNTIQNKPNKLRVLTESEYYCDLDPTVRPRVNIPP